VDEIDEGASFSALDVLRRVAQNVAGPAVDVDDAAFHQVKDVQDARRRLGHPLDEVLALAQRFL
jgi:hypothetical protein